MSAGYLHPILVAKSVAVVGPADYVRTARVPRRELREDMTRLLGGR